LRDLKAICFDLDNTLWDVDSVIARAERVLLAWLAERYPLAMARYDLASMRALRARMAQEFPDRRHDLTFLRTQAIQWQLEEAGYEDAAAGAEAAFEVFFAVRNEVTPYPDVLPALERLRVRYRLMSLSNGNADLARIGLDGFFESSIGAREAGVAKPDRRIFDLLLERAGLEPHEIVYVGDEPLADVVGARSAGWHAIWVNRKGQAWPEGPEPPGHVVRELGAAVVLLEAVAP
jgi:putative hydrolase of the HAD superfamily